MMNLVSKRARNEYINIRMLFLRISFTLASFLMGIVLDLFNKSYMGFLVVFTVSLVFSITDVIVLSKVEEPENRVAEKGRISLSGSSEPLRNAKYRAFLVFIFFYYLSLTMSSAYTSLYQIKYVKLDYSFISVVNVIANIMMVTCTRLWSRVERSRGLWFVLRVSSIFAASEFLIYSFLTERTYYILFFAPILAGIGNSGFNIAILSYRYELMPENNRTAYEGWYGATYGLSTLLAPVIGSFLMGKLPEINNIIYQYGKFQLLYLISFTSCILVIFMMFYRPRKTADVGGESAGI
jgi:MFS family permease